MQIAIAFIDSQVSRYIGLSACVYNYACLEHLSLLLSGHIYVTGGHLNADLFADDPRV